MNENELINLELQIESLLNSRDDLRKENYSLRKQLAKVTQESARLREKNKNASLKIKKIIYYLRNEINDRAS